MSFLKYTLTMAVLTLFSIVVGVVFIITSPLIAYKMVDDFLVKWEMAKVRK